MFDDHNTIGECSFYRVRFVKKKKKKMRNDRFKEASNGGKTILKCKETAVMTILVVNGYSGRKDGNMENSFSFLHISWKNS